MRQQLKDYNKQIKEAKEAGSQKRVDVLNKEKQEFIRKSKNESQQKYASKLKVKERLSEYFKRDDVKERRRERDIDNSKNPDKVLRKREYDVEYRKRRKAAKLLLKLKEARPENSFEPDSNEVKRSENQDNQQLPPKKGWLQRVSEEKEKEEALEQAKVFQV